MNEFNSKIKKQCYWIIPIMAAGFIYQLFATIGFIYCYFSYLNTNQYTTWGIEGFCVFRIYAMSSFDMINFGWTAIWSAVLSLLFFGMMIYLFLRMLREETPFTKKTAILLKIESLIFFLMTAFPVIIRIIGWRITKQVGTEYTDLIYGIPGTAILYGLAKIFEYGSSLQKLSDETL